MKEDFSGKAVVITGAASGLGRATTIAFAAAGARVAAIDVNVAGLEETAALVTNGETPILLSCDLTDAAACTEVIGKAAAALGGIDALCNVAGLLFLGHSASATPAAWDKVFAVNVRAPFFLFQAALPYLVERQGAVVNVASASAFLGCAYITPYAASKAALVNLTKSLAMEYVKSPIRINAIAPGAMDTPMAQQTNFPDDLDFDLLARFSGIRPGNKPEELTGLILFLCSPAASAIHGAAYNIDGGATTG